MEKFGLSRTAAERFNQEYTVPFRTRLNHFINEQNEKRIPKEDIILACVEKFSVKYNEIEQYIRRLHWFQLMDAMTQKLFEGIYF